MAITLLRSSSNQRKIKDSTIIQSRHILMTKHSFHRQFGPTTQTVPTESQATAKQFIQNSVDTVDPVSIKKI